MLTQAPEGCAESLLARLPEGFGAAGGTLCLHSMSGSAAGGGAAFPLGWGRAYAVGRSAGRVLLRRVLRHRVGMGFPARRPGVLRRLRRRVLRIVFRRRRAVTVSGDGESGVS